MQVYPVVPFPGNPVHRIKQEFLADLLPVEVRYHAEERYVGGIRLTSVRRGPAETHDPVSLEGEDGEETA